MMLSDELVRYARTNTYPFHMPGHKRRMAQQIDAYAIDITEIDGFDNLHDAQGLLKDAQQRAADLYGASRSFYLVNGSTCGLLAAICATTKRRGKILVARNCHKAVYHGIYLQELWAEYLYPEISKEGIACAIDSFAVQEALEKDDQIQAVLITSPTYDGVVSDVEQIARIVHEKGKPLIVDEAHGAHFGIESFSEKRLFPDSAVHCGADLVIQSLHKTLPSYTQTALLHICSNRVDAEAIERYLDIFETSSPSYVLMAGMDRCIRSMQIQGQHLLHELKKNLLEFGENIKGLEHIRLLNENDFLKRQAFDFDGSKLLLYTGDTTISGKELYDILRTKYGLQLEMASGNYALAMTSVMDTKDGFERLAQALLEIDATLEKDSAIAFPMIYKRMEQKCSIAEAVDGKQEIISTEQAVGRTAAEYIYLYPPGIPLLAPGERIVQTTIEDIDRCKQMGLSVHGLLEDTRIKVVN